MHQVNNNNRFERQIVAKVFAMFAYFIQVSSQVLDGLESRHICETLENTSNMLVSKRGFPETRAVCTPGL